MFVSSLKQTNKKGDICKDFNWKLMYENYNLMKYAKIRPTNDNKMRTLPLTSEGAR